MSNQFNKEDVESAVLDSGVLGTSKHQRDLFKYLLDAKFDGRVHNVKAYSIAIDVFGRDSNFDSGMDSIVRVEMFRLRGNLKAFNQESDKFHLELKKASYNIQIKEPETAKLAIAEDTATRDNIDSEPVNSGGFVSRKNLVGASLISAVFAGFLFGRFLYSPQDRANCSDFLPNVEVVSHSKDLNLDIYIEQSIKGAAAQFSHVNIVPDAKSCRYTGTPGYEIQYAAYKNQEAYHTTISAVSEAKEKIISTQNITSRLENSAITTNPETNVLFYDLIKAVNDILKPNGIIAMNALTADWNNKRGSSDFRCIPIMYDSFVSDSDEDYLEALRCLESAYLNDTKNPDNLGGLAASYFSQVQNFSPRTTDDPRQRAQMLIDQIGNDWASHVETVVSQIYFEAEHPEYNSQRMRNTLMIAEKNFSTHPVIISEVARYAGFRLGDWEYAREVSNHAKRLHSERDNSVFFIDAAYSIVYSSPEDALPICVKTYSENSILSNLLVNACAVRATDQIWIDRTEKNLKALNLATYQDRIAFIDGKNYDDVFKRAIKNVWLELP